MKTIATHVREHWNVYLSSFAALLLGLVAGAKWSSIPTFVDCLVHLAPLGTAVSAIVAVISLSWQARRARFNQRIDLMLKFAERFEKPEWRKTRADAARALRADRQTHDEAVSDLLAFFEEIGFLFDCRAVDLDAVYEFFSYWLSPYYQAARDYITWERQDTGCTDLYTKLEKLYEALDSLERRQARQPLAYSSDDLDKFLLREEMLVLTVSAS
ncbi:DUF4760 domain-containing protein [Burkholderia pyrrocinia]|uniref:DUF4760 domain-containing protein n=1 Tax=Burkholderia pyrrocinia TaxID=60550 RepID=UPI00158984C0|nr:hypothetical protein [Burkholderia pyrrocinia]